MSYEPTNWKDGDLVTSAKLNKLEQGVASSGGGNIVTVQMDTTRHLTKTWQEIYDSDIAIFGGITIQSGKSWEVISSAYIDDGAYCVDIGETTYSCESANGYPATDRGK